MNIIGNVEGKKVIILDDMVDTAGTVVQAASAIKGSRRFGSGCLLHASRLIRAGPRAH